MTSKIPEPAADRWLRRSRHLDDRRRLPEEQKQFLDIIAPDWRSADAKCPRPTEYTAEQLRWLAVNDALPDDVRVLHVQGGLVIFEHQASGQMAVRRLGDDPDMMRRRVRGGLWQLDEQVVEAGWPAPERG